MSLTPRRGAETNNGVTKGASQGAGWPFTTRFTVKLLGRGWVTPAFLSSSTPAGTPALPGQRRCRS